MRRIKICDDCFKDKKLFVNEGDSIRIVNEIDCEFCCSTSLELDE